MFYTMYVETVSETREGQPASERSRVLNDSLPITKHSVELGEQLIEKRLHCNVMMT